ncbi:alpha/beta fold hydrolase [Pedobacter rhizosphaerae]|uniref:PGAP1-like protein n=1 Tax=Pedobacter rhizosphaerae TaxID=390241 RepID=A0A1H9VW37_9SPHI|nr:hypothetical protein [Pedobacter rhizosphaerae]SES25513.1 hypothetical protein SAMN04488023_15019 [Pedobacter rhizosphaerae]
MKLIFVHGHTQLDCDALELKKKWTDALKTGLSRSGLSMPISKNDIELPYFGALLQGLATSANWALEQTVKQANISHHEETRLIHDFLLEVAKNTGINIQQMAIDLAIPDQKRSPLNWAWVTAILESLDKQMNWGELSIRRFIYELFCYLTDPVLRVRLNDIVKNQIDEEPCVVVGHGMGSIIAYNVMMENPHLQVSRLITLGNPMGLQSISAYLNPISIPKSLRGDWYNVQDDLDPFAQRSITITSSAATYDIHHHGGLRSRTKNHHDMEGYLNDQTVGRQVYDALAAEPKKSSNGILQYLKTSAILGPYLAAACEFELFGCLLSYY